METFGAQNRRTTGPPVHHAYEEKTTFQGSENTLRNSAETKFQNGKTFHGIQRAPGPEEGRRDLRPGPSLGPRMVLMASIVEKATPRPWAGAAPSPSMSRSPAPRSRHWEGAGVISGINVPKKCFSFKIVKMDVISCPIDGETFRGLWNLAVSSGRPMLILIYLKARGR